MPQRTEHGHQRHEQGDRPTQYAFRDKESPVEVYRDTRNGNHAFIGPRGRTHLFTPDGKHHTSFYTERQNRRRRVRRGEWIRIELDSLEK